MRKKLFFILLGASFAAGAVTHYLHMSTLVQILFSCIAVILAAAFLGQATESVAHYAGERLGGFLNATFGNAAELIIAIFLVKDGFYDMVKASLTGAIIGNSLLVLGVSVLIGGMKFRTQSFNVKAAAHNASLMLLAVIALFVPATFVQSLTRAENEIFSLIVAGILITAYILWLLFSMITHKEDLADVGEADHGEPLWTKSRSVVYLALATVMVAFISEWLVGNLESFSHQFGLSELFVGAFLIAIIGNAAEHSAAVLLAMKNKIGASFEIAIGSSLQIALFVAPLLIIISYFYGNTMNIIFTPYELAAIAVAVVISNSISRDGSTNWYEGVLLIVVYLILGIAFFLV